ncbi:MAG: AEC family transporter [Methanobrevibacter sp.]|nr:AEC family transporter [Methanobrevibacter sp.]
MPSPIEVILVPTIMILLGVFLRYIGFLSHEDRDLLSKIVLYIALPSMLFMNLKDSTISSDMIYLPVLGVITSFILLIIAYIYCRANNYSKKATWTIMIGASIMNTGFIGFPVSLGVFGNSGLSHAIFYDLSTSILVIIYGILLAKEFGGNSREVLKKAVLFMPVWGVIFGLIFNVFNIPLFYVAESILDYLSQATIPLIMLSIGLSLDFRNVGNNLKDSLAVSAIKLVMAPAIIFTLLTLFNIKGMAFNVALIEAGMSTAGNALVLAIEYGLDADLMGSIIFTNVILSVFSLTAIISFLT